MSAKNTKQTKATKVSPYVPDEDIQSVETFVRDTLDGYKNTVSPIKAHATSVSNEDIREKAIDAIVDTLIKRTASKNFPNFTYTDLKTLTAKLIKKLLSE